MPYFFDRDDIIGLMMLSMIPAVCTESCHTVGSSILG